MPEISDAYLKLNWKGSTDRFLIEQQMIRHGGYIKGVGNGLAYHYKAAMTALWPHFKWQRWSELLVKSFSENDEIGVMGPASSGKTYTAGAFGLATFFMWPKGTSIIVSSTTRDGLQLRVWGAMKELFNRAKAIRPWLPGRIIESRFMITGADDDDEAQDFRDGIIGVPCKVGGTFVGLSNYVGLKNERVLLIADEASLMGSGFYDSISNLRKNDSFKLIAMGNPKDRTDCLGKICEPAAVFGGWDGQDYEEKTRTWRTRARNGIAIQICGYDSPNYDFPRGLNPYKGLITPEQIEADLAYYGTASLQFSMMNLGVMPKDGGTRRVITKSLCEQNQAFEDVVWDDITKLTHVVGVDAAYSGVGGDRCVMTHLVFGPDRTGKQLISFAADQVIIPVMPTRAQLPEEQIAEFVRLYCVGKKIPPENMGLDSTGKGDLVGALARLWSPQIIPINFGGKPFHRPIGPGRKRRNKDGTEEDEMEDEVYGKMVTALWYTVRLIIEAKQLRKLPTECADEGYLREWGVNQNTGKIDVETKDKTKERMGRSPDLFDSLVVAIEVARKRGFGIASGPGVGIVRRVQPSFLKAWQKRDEDLTKRQSLTYA